MNQLLQRNLQLLLNQVASGLNLDLSETEIFLQDYIIDMSLPPQSGLDEAVKIVRDSKGKVTLATSMKVPNLRFKLGDLLFELYRASVSLSASENKFYIQLLIGLDFLRRIRQLATMTIPHHHVNLLIIIFQLTQTEKIVTVDAIHELLQSDIQDSTVADSLAELERLKCIKVNMQEIELNETIDIVGQEL